MWRNIVGWIIFVGMIGIMPTQGDIVINEIMYHPSSNDPDAEYLELYNTDTAAIDLSGWELQSGVDFLFPKGTTIKGNGYLLVCRNEVLLRSFYNLNSSIQSVGNYAPTKASNSGEEICLYDKNGKKIDCVEYSDEEPWPKQADGKGSSLELVHPLVDNNNVIYWTASSIPTPGTANSTLVQTVPPRIQAIERDPQSPRSSDTVQIKATFAKDDPLQSVSLNYFLNGGAGQTLTMTRQGDTYVAQIPAHTQGTVIEYTITASNSAGFQVTAPFGQAARRFLYQVNNNPPSPGSVVINEIMYNNPSQDGVDREWVELYNPSLQAIDLSYWSLKDSNDDHIFRFPADSAIEAHGFFLLAKEKDPGWTAPTLAGLPFSFNDKGDAVRLFDPNDQEIASVEFNDNGEWPAGADGEGGSLELLQVDRPNGEANNWAVSAFGGTPGKANARAIADPTYRDFDIVLNELFYHPEDEEYDDNLEKEYIELFNRSDQTIDLSGWYFSNGVEYSFPQGTTIPAGGYLLVCRNTSLYPDIANKIGNFILQLSNAGEALALTNDLGVVVDYVRFNDKFPWPGRPDGDGYSLELIVPTGDNRVPYNWRSGQPLSPGAPNAIILSNAPPQIDEINHTPRYPSASTKNQDSETKTLIATGEQWRYFKGTQAPPQNWNAVDFDDTSWSQGRSGFGYGDNDDNTVLNDMQNGYLTVYIRKEFTLANPEGFANLILGVDYDDAFVAYLNGVEIARFNITGNPPAYNQSADGNHEAGAMEDFDITSYANLLRPGKNILALQGHNYNSSSSDFSLIPNLSAIQVLEEGEDDSDAILITAKAQDPDGIAEVLLHYQRCSSPYGTGLVFSEWKTAPMVDNGTGGDLKAGDGIYSAKLNYAETIRPTEIWRYKISAKDQAGQETLVPLSGEKTETYAFFVQDQLNIPLYPTIYMFAERTVLDWLNRNVESDIEQPSLVVIDGDVYDLTTSGGIRYRGNTLRNKPKKSWKIRFPKDNRWKGRRAYNLNANYQTSPLLRGESGFMEHLAYQFMHQVGVPAVDTQHYRLMLNNSYYGLFIGLEQYNEDFLEDHDMPVETQIFKAGVKARRSYMSPESNFDAYAQKYENAIGRSEDIQDLITFIEGMNNAPDLKAFFEAYLDIETYLNYIASVAVLSHVDSTEKNYFPTRGADGRWFMMPWDMSHAWGEIHTNDTFPLISNYSLLDGAEGGIFGTNQLRRKFLSVPEFRAQYYQRLRDFVDHSFTHEHLDPIFNSYWNYLELAIQENVQRWNSPGSIVQMIAEMKKYITARREFILKDPNVRPTNTPTAPTDLSPDGGTVLANRSVELGAGVPISSAPIMLEWEIQEGSADFFQPLWTRRQEENMPMTQVPAYVLASGSTYYWRVRYQTRDGLWSDWSEAATFKTSNNLEVPDVADIVVTSLNESVRLEWTLPVASDLLRVDVYQGTVLAESTDINDNRVRIRDLENGVLYTFTIKVVSNDLRTSQGVVVQARPLGTIAEGNVIAYYRFEGNAAESIGLFPDGRLLGTAAISAPPAIDPIPLTEQTNSASLQLNGIAGNGFQFGSSEPYLDVEKTLTLECFAQFSLNAITPGVLLDRYDESNASTDGIWRLGVGLSNLGSIDFFFNDSESTTGYNGRFHVATAGGIAPYDGLFHHYAAVIDLNAQNASQKVSLFLDGKLIPSSLLHEDGVSSYSSFRTESDLPILIGARRTPTGTTDVIPGRIDEVRLTAGILSPKQFLIGPDITAIPDWSLY